MRRREKGGGEGGGGRGKRRRRRRGNLHLPLAGPLSLPSRAGSGSRLNLKKAFLTVESTYLESM